MRYVTLKVDICHLPLEEVSHKLLPLLTLNTSWKEFRVRSGVRHSVFWEKLAEQAFRLLDIFRGRFYESNFCISSYLEKHENLSCDVCSWWLAATFMRLAIIFWKNVFLIACTPPSPQSHIYWPSSPTSLVQFLRAIWNAAFRAIVLILPPIKLGSQLSHCAFFSVDSCKRNKFVFYVSHCMFGSFCHSCLIFTLNNTGPTWRNPMLRSIKLYFPHY